MKKVYLILLCFFGVLLSGCATVNGPSANSTEVSKVHREFQVKALLHETVQLKRISRIGYDLIWAISPHDILGKGRTYIGLFTLDQNAVAQRLFQNKGNQGVHVGFVLGNTPVAKAGIKPGDLVTHINGKAIFSVSQLEKAIDELERQTEAQITIRRQDDELVVPVMTEYLPLDVRFRLSKDQTINAITSFRSIEFSFGLMNFVQTDTELAAVLGHELAHIARLHTRNIPVINMAGVFANKLTKDIERDADYFAIKFLHKAGYDLVQVAQLYERLAIEIPQANKGGILYTHPSAAERIVRIRKAIKEFQGKYK